MSSGKIYMKVFNGYPFAENEMSFASIYQECLRTFPSSFFTGYQ